jgi:hypothetical protein
MNSGTENDSVKDEKTKERTKKYGDMDGFEGMIREAWEGQKRTKKILDNITLIALFLSFLAFGSLLMLVFFLRILVNPYSLPIFYSGIGYSIYFPFYGISIPYMTGYPLIDYLAVSLFLPMQFLIVQSMSPILQMQILFYLILGLILIVLSAGLVKMKNWARIGTIIYFFVSLGYSFLTITPILVRGLLQLALFNVNIIVALGSIITRSPVSYDLFALSANLLYIILAVIIFVYLSGDVKYVFDQEKAETLLQDLKYGVEPDRLRAAEALGVIGDDRAVEPLIQALKDKDWKIRASAAKALGKMGDERALKPLFQTLNDENNRVRRYAEFALIKIIKNKIYEVDSFEFK